MFTEQGYAATSIDDIIQQAGAARGALYHHFPGKEALFQAVYETVEAEVVAAVVEAAAAQSSPWDGAGRLSTFLDAPRAIVPAGRRARQRVGAPAKAMELGIDPVELPMLRNILTPLLGTTTFDGMAVDAGPRRARWPLRRAAVHRTCARPVVARAEVDRVLDTLISGLLGCPPSTDGRAE